jgi:3'-5' exoribonuclease
MKSAYVAELEPEQTITGFFLVCDKQIRTTREGKRYLRLELGDRTGTIEARMWENFEEAARSFDRDDFVKVQARVESYRGRNQLAVERLRQAAPTEIQLSDYFPHTAEDVEVLYAQLRDVVAGIANPWLKRLLEAVIEDPEIAAKLKRAPAAKLIHHAYLGGLLEHIVSLCGLCRAVARHYPDVDADLLLTGAILHDIGKIDELSYERAFAYTTEGQLLGHIVLELELVKGKLEALQGFPPELKTVVQHLLASHHGRYEFGSPRLPMFREAVLLHYLDDLDSKMGAISTALASEEGEGDWTAWNTALERRLLRVDRYLAGAGSGGEQGGEAGTPLPPKLKSSWED